MIQIDAVYVISAPQNIERRNTLFYNFTLANKSTFLPPIQHFQLDNPPKKLDDCYLSLGAWDCRCQHLFLYEYFLEETTYNNILILEDDCIFSAEFENDLQQILSELPQDFEFLFVGGQFMRGLPAARDCKVKYCKVNQQMNRLHCYILNRSAAEKIYCAMD